MPESFTSRGFANYCDVTDRYGNEVIVRKSSLASDNCVWIFCNAGPDWPRVPDPLGGTVIEPSPHLTVDQARQVRDALDEFIRDYEKVCAACGRGQSKGHEDWCPVVTGTLSSMPTEEER